MTHYRMLAGYAVKLTAIVALYVYMYLENKRRDREAVDGQEVEAEGVENGMLVSYVTPKSTAQANLRLGQNRDREQRI